MTEVLPLFVVLMLLLSLCVCLSVICSIAGREGRNYFCKRSGLRIGGPAKDGVCCLQEKNGRRSKATQRVWQTAERADELAL